MQFQLDYTDATDLTYYKLSCADGATQAFLCKLLYLLCCGVYIAKHTLDIS